VIRTLDFSKATPSRLRAVQAAMARDGAVKLDHLFPLPLIKELRAEVLRRHESGALRRRALIRDIAGRYAALLPFEGPFARPAFYANPKALAAMEALLGPDLVIGSLETVIALPGAYGQHQHIDGPARFDTLLKGRKTAYAGDLSKLPPYAVTLCVPLCDITEDNGPTAIWPGSHKLALRSRPPGAAEVGRRFPMEAMTGKLGFSFLFDFRVFHCGLENYTAQTRPLLMFVFTRSWYRDPNHSEVHPSVVISPRALARVPPRHKKLFFLAPAARRALYAGL
jgi:ectoine hydroxylase-related dioxygenase (phytanoyl-CoA dioxygenase family)